MRTETQEPIPRAETEVVTPEPARAYPDGFGCLSLSFSFFSSVSIIQVVTISMVRVVMDIFINQNASKFFIDFLLYVLLKSGARGFFVLARVCSYCAGVNMG